VVLLLCGVDAVFGVLGLPDAQPERSRQSFLFCRHVIVCGILYTVDQHADYRNLSRAHAGPETSAVMLTNVTGMIGSKVGVLIVNATALPLVALARARGRQTRIHADDCPSSRGGGGSCSCWRFATSRKLSQVPKNSGRDTGVVWRDRGQLALDDHRLEHVSLLDRLRFPEYRR